MKRLLPLIILMIMGVMLMISWSNIADTKTEATEKYKTLIEKAEKYEEKKIYIDAVKQYDTALKLKPDYNLSMHVADLYQELGNDKSYLSSLDTAISCEPKNPAPYLRIIEHYKNGGDANKLYKAVVRAKDALADSDQATEEQKDEINDLLKKLLGDITVYDFPYDSFNGFHRYENSGTSYASVSLDGMSGLIDATGSEIAGCSFDEIGYPGGGFIPTKQLGEYYYIDMSGNRKIVPDEPATAIGAFGGGVAPLQVDGKYGYIDTQMNESHYDYEYAGSFENGIAPVKQDGKWFVINTQFAPVGPNFDEILVDAYGFCAPYGVYFGKSGNSWGMYSTAGEKIADGFEEVRQFASTQPAAVKKDGKWCFISLSGEIVLETTYEDADSFSLDYAPVQKGGIWGCINQDGEMIVDPQFKMLGAFNEEGNAIGENAEGLCTVSIPQYK